MEVDQQPYFVIQKMSGHNFGDKPDGPIGHSWDRTDAASFQVKQRNKKFIGSSAFLQYGIIIKSLFSPKIGKLHHLVVKRKRVNDGIQLSFYEHGVHAMQR